MTLDPVAALMLDEAGDLTARVLVVDEPALANQLRGAGHDVVACCDDLLEERLLEGDPARLDEPALAGVELVLLRLPKSLGMLEDYAQRISAWAGPQLRLVAGGREKHLSRGMNDVLASSFAEVHASRGRQKSRVLHASGPLAGPRTWPRTTRVDELDLTVVSHGGVFASGRLDAGTRLLLSALKKSQSGRAVDLGCGTGIVASWLARRGDQVLAVDTSLAACDSTRDTAAANGLSVEVQRTDSLTGVGERSIDLVACNPPFHVGTTKDSTPGFDLLRSAVPALATGGELWTVYNSHLPYLPFLHSAVGPTSVAARDSHYTVTRSVRG